MSADETKPRYQTTSAEWRERGLYSGDGEPREAEIPDPDCPGAGWEMVGSAATEGRLFWYWRRTAEEG